MGLLGHFQRAAAGLPPGPESASFRARLAWYDGILAFLARDRPGLARAKATVRETKSFHSDLLEGTLAAFDRALIGDRGRAAKDLASLEATAPTLQMMYAAPIPSWPPSIGSPLPRGLVEAGDPSRAAQLLTWLEAGQGLEWGALVAFAEGPT